MRDSLFKKSIKNADAEHSSCLLTLNLFLFFFIILIFLMYGF